MKKILSVVLAVVMMFSVSIIAFAEKGSSIELDKEYTVTLKNDTVNYTFTAPEDGAYRLSASIKFKEKDFGIASVVVGNEEKILWMFRKRKTFWIFQILKMMIFSWQKKTAIWMFPLK